jgi:Ca-activated chloride channel family protein
VLPATAGDRKQQIQQALAQLEAGGSTNGGQGIELAYSLATKNFMRGGVNRVLLATDGDFNVGVTSQSELVDLIQRKAKTGVFLSVLGVGAGNYQDSMLEKLADKGNGNYAYVDSPAEAEKVLVEQASGTLVTVAKDVKLQLEFNPTEVAGFRLIGYENRLLQHQDFNDDSKDAGEVGAGHSVTALYEIIPAGGTVPSADVDPLKYQTPAAAPAIPPGGAAQAAGELLNIKLRYQPPEGGASRLKELALRGPVNVMNGDFRFAAALAEFGMLLRQSPHRGTGSYEQVLQLAQGSLGDGTDRQAREQFVELVQAARRLTGAAAPVDQRPSRPSDPLNGNLP